VTENNQQLQLEWIIARGSHFKEVNWSGSANRMPASMQTETSHLLQMVM
jgi:hypothetical protein